MSAAPVALMSVERGVPSVVVYADGQVAIPNLEPNLARSREIRIPIPTRMSVRYREDVGSRVSLNIQTYSRRGAMFDGRPIFCDDEHWSEVREAFAFSWFMPRDEEQAVLHVRSILRKLVKPTGGLELDEDRRTFTPGDGRQCRELAVRWIVVIPRIQQAPEGKDKS